MYISGNVICTGPVQSLRAPVLYFTVYWDPVYLRWDLAYVLALGFRVFGFGFLGYIFFWLFWPLDYENITIRPLDYENRNCNSFLDVKYSRRSSACGERVVGRGGGRPPVNGSTGCYRWSLISQNRIYRTSWGAVYIGPVHIKTAPVPCI